MRHEGRVQELLRERDRTRRSMQVWVALLVIWVVVVGWIVWGIVNAVDGDSVSVWAWVAYFAPAAALAVGSLLTWSRWRGTDRSLRALAEGDAA